MKQSYHRAIVISLLLLQAIAIDYAFGQGSTMQGYVDVRLDGPMMFKDNLLTINAEDTVKAIGGIYITYKGKQYVALATDKPAKPVTSFQLPLVQFTGSFFQPTSVDTSNLISSVVNNQEIVKRISNDLYKIKSKSKYKEIKVDETYTVYTTEGVDGGLIEAVRVGGVNERWIPLSGIPWFPSVSQGKSSPLRKTETKSK